MSFFVIPHAGLFLSVRLVSKTCVGLLQMQVAMHICRYIYAGGGTRCIRWWYKVWAYRCGTGPVLQVVHVWGYRWYSCYMCGHTQVGTCRCSTGGTKCGCTGGTKCGCTSGTRVGIHRWERGKIASISYSSTTTPASKSQLVPATIPEYD